MDIIWDRLKSNNIDIDKETPSFHSDTCLIEYGEILIIVVLIIVRLVIIVVS